LLLLISKSATAEIELVKGNKINVVTDKSFMDNCDETNLWVDYPNIVNIVKPGNRIFIDDGLISLVAVNVGKFMCKT
jgi:pyruvate kinase